MKLIRDILGFRTMISPIILQLLFWAGIAGTLYGTYILYNLENWAWPFPLVFGPLILRVYFEMTMLSFRSYDRLGTIISQISEIQGAEE